MDAVENVCPTCGAAFRGQTLCPRCGADLEPLMRVMAKAYRLRVAAWIELEKDNAAEACRLAESSLRLHRTEAGRTLLAGCRSATASRWHPEQGVG